MITMKKIYTKWKKGLKTHQHIKETEHKVREKIKYELQNAQKTKNKMTIIFCSQ